MAGPEVQFVRHPKDPGRWIMHSPDGTFILDGSMTPVIEGHIASGMKAAMKPDGPRVLRLLPYGGAGLLGAAAALAARALLGG